MVIGSRALRALCPGDACRGLFLPPEAKTGRRSRLRGDDLTRPRPVAPPSFPVFAHLALICCCRSSCCPSPPAARHIALHATRRNPRNSRGTRHASCPPARPIAEGGEGRRNGEVFAVLFLDNRHRVLACEELFVGTLNGTAVYPREVVRRALHHNCAAVIFSHNHPSGNPEPSRADEVLTTRLREALSLVDVRVLDHLVIGDQVVSFSERGLL